MTITVNKKETTDFILNELLHFPMGEVRTVYIYNDSHIVKTNTSKDTSYITKDCIAYITVFYIIRKPIIIVDCINDYDYFEDNTEYIFLPTTGEQKKFDDRDNLIGKKYTVNENVYNVDYTYNNSVFTGRISYYINGNKNYASYITYKNKKYTKEVCKKSLDNLKVVKEFKRETGYNYVTQYEFENWLADKVIGIAMLKEVA